MTVRSRSRPASAYWTAWSVDPLIVLNVLFFCPIETLICARVQERTGSSERTSTYVLQGLRQYSESALNPLDVLMHLLDLPTGSFRLSVPISVEKLKKNISVNRNCDARILRIRQKFMHAVGLKTLSWSLPSTIARISSDVA